MPPKRPDLAPIVDPGSDSKTKTSDGEKLEITETMSLVVSSGGDQYVVRESGFEKTPSTASPFSSANNAYGKPTYANMNSNSSLSAAGGNRVVASSPGAGSNASGSLSPQALPASMLGRIKFEELELLEIIGHGSQGRVRKVRSRVDGSILALKSINFSSDIEPLRKALVHELERITAIKHPNVVSSYEAYFRNGKMYVLMEFMDCGTLTDVCRKLCKTDFYTEVHIAYIAREILEGMHFVHQQLVMHRDIKPANMLCNSAGKVKISDFGVAGDAHIQIHHTTVGSTPYMSPERIKSLPYTQACDIWSVGISIAEIAIGEYPFGQRVKGKVFELAEIITSEGVSPKWKDLCPTKTFSAELKDFIAQCLRPQDTRPTAEELLKHPFIVSNANKISAEEMGKLFLLTKSMPAVAAPASSPTVSTGSSNNNNALPHNNSLISSGNGSPYAFTGQDSFKV